MKTQSKHHVTLVVLGTVLAMVLKSAEPELALADSAGFRTTRSISPSNNGHLGDGQASCKLKSSNTIERPSPQIWEKLH
jgi:hypothetical protein